MNGPDRALPVRRILTLAGGVLAAVGLVAGGWGFVSFVGGILGDSPESEPMGLWFLMFAGGAFLLVIGLGMLNAGTLRAQSRYVAGETSDALRTAAGAVGQGLRDRNGPFCSGCGAGTSPEARFCSSCGTARV